MVTRRKAWRAVGATCLLLAFGYVSVLAYHLYFVMRWKSDIGGGDSYYQSRDYGRAVALWQDALRLSPRLGRNSYLHADAWTHEHLGDAYRQQGQFGRAVGEYEAALRLDGRPSAEGGLKKALARSRS